MELKRIDRLISGSKSWNDLYQELSTNKQFTQKFKGDVFERVTQAYLLTLPEYKSKLDKVWLNAEIPQQVLKKLNLPPTDFGIDLVAKTKSNEYWTIQCKFKSTKNALTYKELSTFSGLSFVTAKHISLAIVAHTSTKPIRNRKFLGKVTEIGSGAWRNISEDEWENIRKTCSNKATRHVKRKPRPHQRQAIKDSKRYFIKNKESRGKLIMPCATGKSLTAFWIAESLEAKKIIVAVPSLSLIKQSLNDWTKEYLAYGVVPEWLCVCSDESTGKVDIDEFITDTYDLGIPTTTKKQEIVKFLKQRTLSPKIIFTTYQSSPRLAAAAREARTNFDLAILDEAHKTVGIKSKTFSTLLFEEKIKVKKRLFMTATERVLRGKNDEVASMDDSSIYGSSVYTMTFKDAIDQNIISDYKILTIAVSDSEVSNLIENNRYLSSDIDKSNESSAQYLASGIALKKTYKKHKIKHAISFHRSIAQAKQFQAQQDELNKVQSLRPKVENLHISSKKSASERVELIKEFTQFDRSLITNARCLTEGVDVPAIDCVMFVDPKQSTIDIVQAAGRALRKYEGKEFGFILLPIVVPEGMDIEDFAETTAFRNIAKIIAALSSQDERIVEEFRLEQKASSSKGKIINIDAKLKLGKSITIENFSREIHIKSWEKVARLNYHDFEEAREFVRGLNLNSRKYWDEFCKRDDFPLDIPKTPWYTYQDNWTSMGDWLGTGRIQTQKRVYKSFEEAREFVRALNLSSMKEWTKFTKSADFPDDIPVGVNITYKKQWLGYGDFLGTGTLQSGKIEYLSFKEARDFIRGLNLKSRTDWNEYIKSEEYNEKIPKTPWVKYKEVGWNSLGDWLGTGYVASFNRSYKPFREAREFARSLNLNSGKEWYEYTKRENFPSDIPVSPLTVYKKKYKGMGDWLGTGRVQTQSRVYRPFKEAREFARSLNLNSGREWNEYTKREDFPDDIPKGPTAKVYKGQYKGMVDWLDSNCVQEWRSFKEARSYVRSLRLKSAREYSELSKNGNLPEDIPLKPAKVYEGKGWQGMYDWLGNSGNIRFRSFKEARKYVRTLGIKSWREWKAYTKSSNFPYDLPPYPDDFYKDKGWKDVGDWLGKSNHLKRNFKSYEEAKKCLKKKKLKSVQDYRDYSKTKEFQKNSLPVAASSIYKDKGWKGWTDYLGNKK